MKYGLGTIIIVTIVTFAVFWLLLEVAGVFK